MQKVVSMGCVGVFDCCAHLSKVVNVLLGVNWQQILTCGKSLSSEAKLSTSHVSKQYLKKLTVLLLNTGGNKRILLYW